MENNESNDNIMDRILQGKDLMSEIDKFVVVGPYTVFNRHLQTGDYSDTVFNRHFQTGDYSIWNFHFAKIFMGIPFSKIKNLFVNPDFGKEGLHSKNYSLEYYCNAQLFRKVTRIENLFKTPCQLYIHQGTTFC